MGIKIKGQTVINDSNQLVNIADGSAELWLTSDSLFISIGGTTQDSQSLQSLTVNEANKLTTPRTITLSGAVTGSISFDGSANKTISTTVKQENITDQLHLITQRHGGAVSCGDFCEDMGLSCVEGRFYDFGGWSTSHNPVPCTTEGSPAGFAPVCLCGGVVKKWNDI